MSRIRVGGSEPEFKLYPKASYDVMINKAEEGSSRTKGTPQLILKCEIHNGPEKGGKVTLFYVLGNEKAGFRIKALLEAAGIAYDTFDTDRKSDGGKPVEEWEFDYEDLCGCVITMDADHEEYEGKTRNKWSNERPPAGAVKRAAAPTGNGGTQAQAPTPAPAPAPEPRRTRRVQP